MSSTTSFVGKTVIVTGGCGGLGLAIANAFYASGANVAVVDINNELCQAFRKTHEEEKTIVLGCDITKEENVLDLYAQVKSKFTKIDVLVNSAGMMDKFSPVGTLDKGVWDRVMALNLTAPMMMTKEAISHMLDSEIEGSIINIGSLASMKGWCAGTAYTASKHGLIGLTKSTAAFYSEKKIRCNAVLPAGMKTNIASAMTNISQEGYAFMLKGLEIPAVEVASVAKIVLFLASDAASTVSGACISSDNGWSAYS